MSTQEYIRRLSLEAGFILQAVAIAASLLKPGKQAPQEPAIPREYPDINDLERRQAAEAINIITAGIHR